MPRFTASEARSFHLERLALEKGLGSLQKVHRDTSVIFIISLVFSAFLLAGGLFAVWYFVHLADTPLWFWGGVAVWILIALLPPLVNRKQRADRTWLYEYGLITKRGNELQALHWDEIQSIHTIANAESLWTASTLYLKDGRTVETHNGTHWIEQALKRQIQS